MGNTAITLARACRRSCQAAAASRLMINLAFCVGHSHTTLNYRAQATGGKSLATTLCEVQGHAWVRLTSSSTISVIEA